MRKWRSNGVKWFTQLPVCLIQDTHTEQELLIPKDGDSQAPVHSLNQGGPLKFIVVLSEFLNSWTWWARSALVPWNWRDFRKRTWVLSFLLCFCSHQLSLLNFHQDSWLHSKPRNADPAFYRLPLCYVLQVVLLPSSSNCWPPSICQMQPEVEPALNLWKIMAFFVFFLLLVPSCIFLSLKVSKN